MWAKTIESTPSTKAFYDVCPSLVKYCDDRNLIKEYCKIQIPKLYIYGSKNKNTLSFLKYFKENNCCEVAEVSESNHFPFYDNPGEYYKVLINFLTREQRG